MQNAIDSNPVKPSTETNDLLYFCVIQEMYNATLKYTQFLEMKTTHQVCKFLNHIKAGVNFNKYFFNIYGRMTLDLSL